MQELLEAAQPETAVERALEKEWLELRKQWHHLAAG